MDIFDDLSVLTDNLTHRIFCIILYNVTSSSNLISRIVRELLRYSRHVCLNIHLAKGKHRTFRRCGISVDDPTRISSCGSTTILDTRGLFLLTCFNIASFMSAHLELSAAMDESTYSHSSARIFLQVSVTQIA